MNSGRRPRRYEIDVLFKKFGVSAETIIEPTTPGDIYTSAPEALPVGKIHDVLVDGDGWKPIKFQARQRHALLSLVSQVADGRETYESYPSRLQSFVSNESASSATTTALIFLTSSDRMLYDRDLLVFRNYLIQFRPKHPETIPNPSLLRRSSRQEKVRRLHEGVFNEEAEVESPIEAKSTLQITLHHTNPDAKSTYIQPPGTLVYNADVDIIDEASALRPSNWTVISPCVVSGRWLVIDEEYVPIGILEYE